MRDNGLVVAIDGPSGAGKSTAGRSLAERLGYTYIDTGAMYRALALKAMRAGVSLDSEEALATLGAMIPDGSHYAGVEVNGDDIMMKVQPPDQEAFYVGLGTFSRVRGVCRLREPAKL